MKWQVNDAAIVPIHFYDSPNNRLLRVVGLTEDNRPFVQHYTNTIIDDGNFIYAGRFKRTWWGGWKFIPNKRRGV